MVPEIFKIHKNFQNAGDVETIVHEIGDLLVVIDGPQAVQNRVWFKCLSEGNEISAAGRLFSCKFIHQY